MVFYAVSAIFQQYNGGQMLNSDRFLWQNNYNKPVPKNLTFLKNAKVFFFWSTYR